MSKNYNEMLLEKLEQVSMIAESMDDVDAAYLAGKLEGLIDSRNRRAEGDA